MLKFIAAAVAGVMLISSQAVAAGATGNSLQVGDRVGARSATANHADPDGGWLSNGHWILFAGIGATIGLAVAFSQDHHHEHPKSA